MSDSRPSGYGSKSSYGNNSSSYSSGTMMGGKLATSNHACVLNIEKMTNIRCSGYHVREELPLPTKPPYTVHLGNLSFDATTVDVQEFFAECQCTNVRIIEDKMEMKPKGFGYAEFATLDGLKLALTLNGSVFQSRNIRISVADPRMYQFPPPFRRIDADPASSQGS